MTVVNHLRLHCGLKIGSCTGFTSPIMADLKEIAASQGFIPDVIVTADLVPQARPCPHMVWLNAIKLDVHPIEAIIKVGGIKNSLKK